MADGWKSLHVYELVEGSYDKKSQEFDLSVEKKNEKKLFFNRG